ncbi:MAG: hypothetical protein NC247_15175 [Ruminococcus flavefaciens]|nr:hypothetical protein [Ruminococcus flavefaciens]
MNGEKVSEQIAQFISFLSNAESEYNCYLNEMSKQEQLTQDYLHSLELDPLNYSQRSRIATKLAVNRKDRRFYKDKVEEYKPVIDFLSDKNNRKIINQLKETLGKVRKAEKYHDNRIYVPKVLKEQGHVQ